MTDDDFPPLPDWVLDHWYNRYTIDINAAIAAGEKFPIDLSKIPQFNKFWTNPPTRGTIYFENYHP